MGIIQIDSSDRDYEEIGLLGKWIVHKLGCVTSIANTLWYFITEYNYILYNVRKVNCQVKKNS